RLADREEQFLIADVDEHLLEYFVEIERLTGRVLVVPRERAVVGPERDGGRRVERVVEGGGRAAGAHPRLRLRDAPVSEIEIRIVGAGDPGLAANAELIG